MDYPDNVAEELAELQKQLPEGTNMEDFIANVSEKVQEFMRNQTDKPVGIQLAVFFAFLLIPVSLILLCFCKLLNNQKKRQGKEKKKQKETKKDTKKRA